MNLVDSSGWIEYFTDGKNADFFARAIEKPSELILSSINIYEVYKKVLIEKDEYSAQQIIGIMNLGRIISVDESIAMVAAKISYENKIPMADSIIYSTALMNNAIVWTQDEDFKKFKNVKYIKK